MSTWSELSNELCNTVQAVGKGVIALQAEGRRTVSGIVLDEHTIIVTTVHERQVVREGTVPTTAHDIHVDLVVTPERVVRCRRPRSWRLAALRWEDLTDDKIAAIPLLARLRDRRD